MFLSFKGYEEGDHEKVKITGLKGGGGSFGPRFSNVVAPLLPVTNDWSRRGALHLV